MGMTLGLTYYAVTCKQDYTICGAVAFAFLFAFATAGLFVVFFGPAMHIFYCCMGVVVFSFYIIYDTQMIIGGKHRQFAFSKERYILAAVTLYLDIINLFLYILQLLNQDK